ncbi:MAG TPA: hypothetical protein VNB49_04655 [Candidatus Dormibacteraeota bacterium]|nr:hypothetical protein [Candidatus Dormibacteraeota bacterium]
MKSLCVGVFLLLGGVSGAQAQVGKATFQTDNAAPDFSETSAAMVTLPDCLATSDSVRLRGAILAPLSPAPRLNTALLAEPAPADPATPSPKPRFVYGGREDYRWQLSLGFTWFGFRSSAFNSNTFGVKTTATYFLNEWLGVEGSFTGAFGGAVGGNDAKIAVYGAGPKIAWRQKRWEPWLHGIIGGAHEGPQTLAVGRNAYSIMAGGGGDYRWNPHISYRLEANYVRTGFFHQGQNNFQVAVGAVVHF